MLDSNLIDSFVLEIVTVESEFEEFSLRRENTFSARALSHATDESLSSDDSITILLAFLLMFFVDAEREDFIVEKQ